VISIFGPVRATRLAYRNRREPNLYPAGAQWMLPDDPYSLGMRALTACHLAEGGRPGPGGHRSPDRGQDRPGAAGPDRRGPGRLDR
jgi:hypothetical protein